MRLRLVAALALLLLLGTGLAACAGGGGPGAHRGDPNLISPEEVQEANARNAYELVQRLRPRWLQSRGARSDRLSTQKLVFVDGNRQGGLDVLSSISIDIVVSVRYLDASRAAAELSGLGTDHTEGVIQILTR